MPQDPKATSRTKRHRENVTLLRQTMRGREAAQRVVEAFDAITRVLVDGLDDDHAPETPPAAASTRIHPAIDADTFTKVTLERFSEAKTDADRENVRSLVLNGVTSNIISDDQAEALLEQMK